jgi:tRNA/rRNA methyltransferase
MNEALERVRVVLVAPSHPGNVGASARAMLTMGIARLVLVTPRRFPDPEAVALASGATSVLDTATIAPTLADALVGCVLAIGFSSRPREFAGRVFTAREAGAHAIAAAPHGDVALVFGTEMSGLSNADLERCHAVATIAANPEYGSLNLAAAVQVACYETRIAASGDAVWDAPRFAPATADEIDALRDHAARTLIAMRFLDPRMPKRLMPRLARLFARAQLEREEVNILRGILARIDDIVARAAKQ